MDLLRFGHTHSTKACRRHKRHSNDGDIAMMVEDPLCDQWTTGPIANSLRDKLGLLYNPLMLTVGEIAEILSGIAAHLSIQGSQQVYVALSHMPVGRLTARARRPS